MLISVSQTRAHDGVQGVYRHTSAVLGCVMDFAVFVPPNPQEKALPVLWYLSGLTCTHANVMDKGEYRRMASALGLVIICPDTSPRGDDIPDEPDNWQFGKGAGFYLDATQPPYAAKYQMYSYITRELPALIAANFPVDMTRQGVFGHSMGGHGALVCALRNPQTYHSVSAFAPIVSPSTSDWSRPALEKYLGPETAAWRAYDACALVEDGHRAASEILIDQGTSDAFLQTGLKPWMFESICTEAGQPLTLRLQTGYDHSYGFISSFMEDHLSWHARVLSAI